MEWRLKNDDRQLVAKVRRKGIGLPGEGVLYDPIHYSKLWDRASRRIALGVTKTFRTGVISEFLDRKVPTIFNLSCRLLKGPHLLNFRQTPEKRPWALDWTFDPIARAGLSVQLLDLSSKDGRSRGWLKFRAGISTTGRRERGFDIDRTYAVPGINIRNELCVKNRSIYRIFDTRAYGEVIVRKIFEDKLGWDRSRWVIKSSFGVEQAVVLLNSVMFRLRFGIGLRPDGSTKAVIDLK